MTDKHYGPHPVASLLLRVGRNYKKITSPIAYIARRFIRHSGEKLTADNRGGCCLDIGAGVAPYEKEICEAFGIESYIPVDVSASDRTKVVADGECLPFQSASVQLLVSFDVIQHLPNTTKDNAARIFQGPHSGRLHYSDFPVSLSRVRCT